MDYKEKQNKVAALGRAIALYPSVSPAQGAKITELKDRLTFRLRVLEEKGLDEKIAAQEKVLEILHGKK